MSGTLILPAWLMTAARELPRKDWGVRIADDCVDDVAPNDSLRARYPNDPQWQADDQVLAPGFVNTHTHLYGVLAHGIPLTTAPSDMRAFLEEFWWPLVENRLDQQMICTATEMQCVRMLQSGVTGFYDCTEAPFALPGCLQAQAQVVTRLGLRGILSFEATERVSAENGQKGLAENAEFIRMRKSQGGLVSGMVCFHTCFTCSAGFVRQACDLAHELGALVHMHCSEGAYEPRYALDHFGKRPMQYYDALGVTGPEMLASQCVQIDTSEIELIAKRGVRVSHMPLSNCEVGGGIAPVPELVASGVRVGLGSDGYVDDFFEVMRGAFLIHKADRQDPTVMPASLVWHLATAGGAEAIGLQSVGRVEKGWQADLQLIDADLPTPLTEANFYEQLLLHRNSSNVRATIVAGQILMRDGSVRGVDLDELRARNHAAAERLWAQIK
ncbi:MAG: amidohydrolase family protein [Chloroflexi bacterium]|nr:amidohydrolase family protein [Chloroflexota bacterium]